MFTPPAANAAEAWKAERTRTLMVTHRWARMRTPIDHLGGGGYRESSRPPPGRDRRIMTRSRSGRARPPVLASRPHGSPGRRGRLAGAARVGDPLALAAQRAALA